MREKTNYGNWMEKAACLTSDAEQRHSLSGVQKLFLKQRSLRSITGEQSGIMQKSSARKMRGQRALQTGFLFRKEMPQKWNLQMEHLMLQ